MLIKDAMGNLYVLSHMYGLYTLRTIHNELIGYGTDYMVLIRKNLGYHAEIIEDFDNDYKIYSTN